MPYKFRQMFAHTILEEYMSNKTVAIRTHYLMMYFPKTIACAANLIEEKNKTCFDEFN